MTRRAVSILVVLLLLAAPAAAEQVRLLVLGDSLAAGYGLSQSQAFTTQLEETLTGEGWDVEVQDGAVSGDTTAGGWARLEWALAGGADAVIVELGANDMLRGIDPSSARANLDAILTTLGQRNIPVLLAGMRAPQNMGTAYVEPFEAMYPELAARHDAILYPFFLSGVAGDPALNQPDGMHPNREGVTVIVDGILPYVVRLLERVPAEE